MSHFPLAKSFDDVLSALAALYSEPHDFRTLVVDSVDHLEPLIHARVCKEKGFSSIEDAGYGKGYVFALDYWRQYVEGLTALRSDRGVTVIQIAHSEIRRFDLPEHEPYQRYEIKLHRTASALLQETSDVVAFAAYRSRQSNPTWLQQASNPSRRFRRAPPTHHRTTELPGKEQVFFAGYLRRSPWRDFAAAMPQSLTTAN